MFEIDKEAFGRFLSEQRKEKGMTQKELAQKLFVSDKAVSKWERALSMPDVALLIPLADALEISVTELLEGRKMEDEPEMNVKEVENIVKKAIIFSEETPEQRKEKRKKNTLIFMEFSLLALCEFIIGIIILMKTGKTGIYTNLYLFEAMSFSFGLYFWIFMKERLPQYYDENKINAVSDGFFRMNVPGVYFNNSNWIYIVRAMRHWAVCSMVAAPVVCVPAIVLINNSWILFAVENIFLIVYLVSMFVPIYIAGKKHG